MLEVGTIIDGKYKILNKIGQGGMSVVYLAMNERANKQWAIKEIRKDGTKDYEVVKQGLIAEIDILKKLNHPHLPSIIDVIDCEDTFLIVMDYIEGRTLDYWLKKEGAQPQELVVDWAKQICDVLGYLHSRKPPIIYRDLKPSNVMRKPDGQLMIIDFGTAREFKEKNIEDTACLGTQGYAAPEQYGGQGQTDARTDIYTLGATMYHLVTGHNPSLPPYEMRPITTWNPKLSTGLEEIIIRCTQKNPQNRYQSCAELMYALEHYGELDIEYKRKQDFRWKSFIACCSLTGVFLLGGIGCRIAEAAVMKNSYDVYLTEASTAVTQEERVAHYQKAINLDPRRGEAWLSLIDLFVGGVDGNSQNNYTQDEDVKMREILGYTGSGNKSNISRLQANKQDYDEFAFQMGMAYFYFYGGEGNRQMSQSWFEAAAQSKTLSTDKVEMSKRFAKIAGYWAKLNNENKTGYDTTYQEYWQDLTSLTEGDITSVVKENTALIIYKEQVYQIEQQAVSFKRAGITETELLGQLAKVETDVKTKFGNIRDVSLAQAETELERLKAQIIEYLDRARQQVSVAYSSLGTDLEGGR